MNNKEDEKKEQPKDSITSEENKPKSPEYKNFEDFFREERENNEQSKQKKETKKNSHKKSIDSNDSCSSRSSFYKEMYINEDTDPNSTVQKYKAIINFKNYFNFLNENDDDDYVAYYKCEICHEKDGGMLLCDICYNAVHEKCLQSESPLSDDWICDRCKFIMSEPVTDEITPVPCFYCPSFIVKGMMKKIKEGHFAHIDCDNYYMNKNNKDFIAKDKKCYLCNQATPYSIKCQFDGCEKTFHYKCQLYKSKQELYCNEHLIKVDEILLKMKRKGTEKK